MVFIVVGLTDLPSTVIGVFIGALIITAFVFIGFSGAVRIYTSGGQLTEVKVTMRQRGVARAFVDRLNSALAERQEGVGERPAPEVVKPAPQIDVTSQLERLAELKRTGALTDEEFDLAKAKVLERL